MLRSEALSLVAPDVDASPPPVLPVAAVVLTD